MTRDYGLGRQFAPDPRDRGFMMAAVLPDKAPAITKRFWWASGWWGDQGDAPQCVEYSWHHFLVDGPITHTPKKGPLWTIGEIYDEAQRIDEWAGEDYDGTSVRAGAKVLQRRGFIKSYRWAFDVDTIVKALLSDPEDGGGPVVIGTNWYYSMFFPNAAGLLSVSGRHLGGHAYLLNGVNTRTEQVRIKNSWGRGWARRGFASMRFTDLERLLNEDGEACIASEIDPTP